MVHPLCSFRVFAAGSRVDEVVGRALLLFRRAEHGQDGETHGLNGKRRRPVVGEDREADVAVAVDVRVLWNLLADEDHRWRVEGVALGELKLKLECLALVQTAFGRVDLHHPPKSTN